MEDYFCKIRNLKEAKLYIEYVSKKFCDEYNVISFNNEDYDLYESYPIIDFGVRNNVSVIPSILCKTSEGIDVVVINPDIKDKRTYSIINHIKEERIFRIINILSNLSDKFNIHISPSELINKIEKSDISDIYLAEDSDIIDLIVDNGYCDSRKEASSNFFDRANIEREFYSYDYIVDSLKHETLFIWDPKYFIDTINDFKYIKGVISDYKRIDKNIKEIIENNNLVLKIGSGK
jgi:hypothetical protein